MACLSACTIFALKITTIMESIKHIYKIGHGPSSSHTMAPHKAAAIFLARHAEAVKIEVTLYGSLAATGRGHLTDVAILSILEPAVKATIVWEPTTFLPFHPNGMKFRAYDRDGTLTEEWVVYSVGGGDLAEEGKEPDKSQIVYPHSTIAEIATYCEEQGLSYWEYVEQYEGAEIWDFLALVWDTMKAAIARGLETEGVLPGGLGVKRKASDYLIRAKGYGDTMKSRGSVYAYALATAEENAGGGLIVTAPTCGSCGVLPAVLYHLFMTREFRETRVLKALATAALFGNIVKTNASISGAEVGCQGEIGVACSMAAAAATQLFGGSLAQIEYAAEMALEHHLGLTCDPVCGLVQIPCIERNAFAAARALDANIYSTFSDGRHRVSFDRVVAVMKQTGHDIPSLYKETSTGGLATIG